MSDPKESMNDKQTVKVSERTIDTPATSSRNLVHPNNIEIVIKDPQKPNEKARTCLSRWFGKMGPGSMRGSMFALAAAAVGGGMLSLPYVCRLCGLVLGLIMIILAFVTSIWSFSMITKLNFNGMEYHSFKELYSAMGGKVLSGFYNWIVIFSLYGTLIGYQIIIASIIQRIMINFHVNDPDQYRMYHIIAVSVAIMFPFCLLRDVSNFRYVIILSIFSIAYTTIIVIIELPYFWINKVASMDDLVWFKLDWSFFSAFGVTFFSFMCQASFYSSTESLTNRNEAHINSITLRALSIDLVIYLVITIAGYMSTLSNTPDLIIDRAAPFKSTAADIQMTIAQILICCSLCIGTPLQFIPMRTAFFEQIFDDPHFTMKRALIGSVIFTVSTCLFAIFVPQISTVTGIVGGIGSVAMAYLIPSIAYFRMGLGKPIRRYVYLTIACLLSAVGIGSSIYLIIEAV